MSMRSIRSELKGSRHPLKLGLAPTPPWKRRVPSAASARLRDPEQPGEGVLDRVRRSEQVEAEVKRLLELAHSSPDKGDA